MFDRRGAGTSCGVRASGSYILYSSLLAIFLGLTTAFLLAAAPAEAQSYRFNDVRVEGNERIEASTIIARMGIERGQSVTAGELNDAYQRVLDSGVFETVELTPRGSTLVVTVSEYPTINKISFEGNRRIKDDVLREVISAQTRRVFTAEQAERDAVAISEV